MLLFDKIRVRRGMRLLDERAPGWRERVRPEQLRIETVHHCVLGQVYGNYRVGANTLGLSDARAYSHGFSATTTKACRELSDVWRLALAA